LTGTFVVAVLKTINAQSTTRLPKGSPTDIGN